MSFNKEKYAVFIDIDGTLISDSFTPPDGNLRAIEKARKKGHLVFINTGRSLANIPDELRDYALSLDGVISGNGSHIVFNGKELFSACFPDSLLFDFCRFMLADESRTCLFEGVDELFAMGAERGRFGRCGHVIKSMDDFHIILEGRRISVIAVKGVTVEECSRRFGEDVAFYSYKSFFDCVLKGCDKAKAVDIILKAAGIPLENTMAIGDSANDRPMIEHCAIGVAMGNADEELKDAADFVTVPNTQSGVAAAIEKFLL
jgi:Cof subfamily protein (haloacid dehalogenase superfamily)